MTTNQTPSPVSTMPTGRCAACGRQRVTTYVQRFGGGTYRRAGRWYQTQVCAECAHRLLNAATPGHRSVERFGITSLRAAAQRLSEEAW